MITAIPVLAPSFNVRLDTSIPMSVSMPRSASPLESLPSVPQTETSPPALQAATAELLPLPPPALE